MNKIVGWLGAAWGAAGVVGLLSWAIYRLAPRAIEAYRDGLSTPQAWIAVAVCVVMAYSEGYRGFQCRFSPRTAARIRYLRDRPDGLRSLLAPLFAMGYLHATRRTRIGAFGLTGTIVVFVVAVQLLEQPWRGIIDAGVVVGLSWGIVSLGWWVVRALGGGPFDVSAETPEATR